MMLVQRAGASLLVTAFIGPGCLSNGVARNGRVPSGRAFVLRMEPAKPGGLHPAGFNPSRLRLRLRAPLGLRSEPQPVPAAPASSLRACGLPENVIATASPSRWPKTTMARIPALCR